LHIPGNRCGHRFFFGLIGLKMATYEEVSVVEGKGGFGSIYFAGIKSPGARCRGQDLAGR
jgi:hypothetical protein